MLGHLQKGGIVAEVRLLGHRHSDLLLETEINGLKPVRDSGARDEHRIPLLGE
jgi:hypothetical protein